MFKRNSIVNVDWNSYDEKSRYMKMPMTHQESSFGMDYGSPGQLGGLGGGYVQPNLMYFGDSFVMSLFNAMVDDPKLASRLNKAARERNFGDFRKNISP